MTEEGLSFAEKVEELRRAFDGSFAVPLEAPAADVEELLAVRVAARPFALRITDLVRVEGSRKIVPLPGDHPDLLGLAGIQGRLVAVHSLATLLGLGPAPGEGRWIAVCSRDEPLGLALDALEGYLRVPRTDVLAVRAGEHLQQAVRAADAVRHVVNVPSILAVIRRRAGSPRGAAKEQ